MTVEMLERKLKAYEEPLESPLLRWLYLHLPPKPIRSKKMYRHYVNTVGLLMEEEELGSLSGEDRKSVDQYVSTIGPFIAEYEKKKFPIGQVTPEEILKFLMEQNDLSQYDLADELGGQPVVSEILNGKRRLTREHIERLGKRFHISPAGFYQPA